MVNSWRSTKSCDDATINRYAFEFACGARCLKLSVEHIFYEKINKFIFIFF
jgi:hypothetical protein